MSEKRPGRLGYSPRVSVRELLVPRLVRRLLVVSLALLASFQAFAQTVPLVAAGADLEFTLPEIARAYRDATGREVRLVFGSSGNLRQQIVNGAPFELFLSSDEGEVLVLATAGLTRDDGRLYGIGRLALVARSESPLDPERGLAGLRGLLEAGSIRRFAIANPEHAPHGRAAREALAGAGLGAALAGKLVLGDNVAQAFQFALSPDADGGIVAYSQVLAPTLAGRLRYTLLPASAHTPLRQRMVLLKRAGPEAEAFHAYLQSPAARAVFERYGFTLPDE